MASLELLLWDKLPRDEWLEPLEATGCRGQGSRCSQGTRRVMGRGQGEVPAYSRLFTEPYGTGRP